MLMSSVIAIEYGNDCAFSVVSGFLATQQYARMHVKKRMDTCIGGKCITFAYFHLCVFWQDFYTAFKATSLKQTYKSWHFANHMAACFTEMPQLCCVWRKLSNNVVAGINAKGIEKWGRDFLALALCLEFDRIFI